MKAFARLGTAAGSAVLGALLATTPLSAADLRVGTGDMPASRGDPNTSLSYFLLFAWGTMFDTLTYADGKGVAQPRLAATWKNTSPTTWEFTLRPNVKFHNGEALTADAVAHTVNYLVSEDGRKNSGIVYNSLRNLASARAKDPLTVEITTAAPGPITPNELSALKIVAPKAWTDLGRAGFMKDPSGTGPFRQVSWDDSKLTVAKFRDSWVQAKVDGIAMVLLPETAARTQALLSGQTDIAITVAGDSRRQIEAAGYRVVVGPTQSVNALPFNMLRPGPLTDVRVRQAINYAIDKSFVQTLLGGTTVVAGQPAPSSVNGYQADIKAYPHDPAKAKQLLAEAGHPNGFKLTAEIVTVIADSATVFQWVSSNLKQVGVDMELKVISLPDLVQRAAGVKPLEGDLVYINYGANPSGDMMRSINNFHSCNAKRWTCIPEIEPTIKAVNEEFDRAKRNEGLRKIAQTYHEQAPAIWLQEDVQIDALSGKVRGYKNENWQIFWEDVELAP